MIPHNKPTLGVEEEEAALRVIRSGYLAEGIEVESFENEFCRYLGLPEGHAVALSSGTSALFLSRLILKGKNQEVILPGYSCAALRNAVQLVSGKEKIVDVGDNSPNIENLVINKFDSKIIVVPHMYGIPVNLSKNKNPNLIEDCAQALGAKVNKNFVGLQGRVGIFSFYATKLITSGGQGGMLISKEKSLVDLARDYREFDYRHDNKYRFNFQMTDLQASIGRVQLKKLCSFLKRREEIFHRYKREGLNLLDVNPHENNLSPVRYRAVMKTEKPKEIIKSLESVGVKAIIPTEDWELLSPDLPNAIKLSKETVSLPIYPSLSDSDLDIILSGLIGR